MSDSPLRYPGGKARLAPFLKNTIQMNDAIDCDYVEPFAGGAGAALDLLFSEYARTIWINDFDPAIYCLWRSIINQSAELCNLIENADLGLDEWREQKRVLNECDTNDELKLGFAAFYLNRTNRSGILTGSVIGGLKQSGKWKIDARFYRESLIARIERIAEYRNRIKVTNKDALKLINTIKNRKKNFVYLDPPYFAQGGRLYLNHYNLDDHKKLSEAVKSCQFKWLITYDDTPEIRKLYAEQKILEYSLKYSAASAKEGSEILISAHTTKIATECLPSLAA